MTLNNPQYLGDGVYVSDDGFQLWLAANHHDNFVIALEPAICRALMYQMQRVISLDDMAAIVTLMQEQVRR